jgi:hypothetical protein
MEHRTEHSLILVAIFGLNYHDVSCHLALPAQSARRCPALLSRRCVSEPCSLSKYASLIHQLTARLWQFNGCLAEVAARRDRSLNVGFGNPPSVHETGAEGGDLIASRCVDADMPRWFVAGNPKLYVCPAVLCIGVVFGSLIVTGRLGCRRLSRASAHALRLLAGRLHPR